MPVHYLIEIRMGQNKSGECVYDGPCSPPAAKVQVEVVIGERLLIYVLMQFTVLQVCSLKYVTVNKSHTLSDLRPRGTPLFIEINYGNITVKKKTTI